jgi:2-methylcitrate dehydratase PrpD
MKNGGNTRPQEEKMTDIISQFVKKWPEITYENLPDNVIEIVKCEILDSLAAALGGSSAAGIKELLDVIREWDGNQQSTVIAGGIKCPAPDAALVNGAMIHILDYDDGCPATLVHIGCSAVSAAFAVTERIGGATGKELITSLALSSDFVNRLALASRPHGSITASGWFPTALYGYFNAAVIAGRIMKLNQEAMLNAIGIAYHQCAGNLQCIYDGALAKGIAAGLAAKGGVTAAIMAERGITGARNCLEGKAGFYNVYHDGDYDARILVDGLGERFETEKIGFKPYPCCGHSHAAIDAALSLRSKYNIKPDPIQDITVYASNAAYDLCVPLPAKQNPLTMIDAQFSLPWTVATALVKGKVTLEDFTKTAIRRADVLEVARKVTCQLDKNLNRRGVGPSRVTIRLTNGSEYSEYVEFCLGSIENPMTFSDCAKKFKECYPYSIRPISTATADNIIELTRNLELLEDANQIIKLLE